MSNHRTIIPWNSGEMDVLDRRRRDRERRGRRRRDGRGRRDLLEMPY